MTDMSIVRKMNDSSTKLLWIQTIGIGGAELQSVSKFLQDANIPWSFIVADDSMELLSPSEIADKFHEIAEFLEKKFTESSAEAPTRLWN